MKLFLRQWQTAFRRMKCGSILTDTKTPFIPIPNTARLTAADPFLFTYQGTKYLFAELYEKKDGLGRLGYAVFDGEKFGAWKIVISEPYHLSYPNIFEYNGNIYIVPEANQSNTLYAYRAVDFPDKWEKLPPMIKDRRLTDTTFLSDGSKHILFTYDVSDQAAKKLLAFSVDEHGGCAPLYGDCLSDDDGSARPGGNFFPFEGDLIRVSQDGEGDYGRALVFSKVLQCDENGYRETVLRHIAPEDLVIDAPDVSGIHTYNADDELEVIDMHVPDRGLYTQFTRLTRKLR